MFKFFNNKLYGDNYYDDFEDYIIEENDNEDKDKVDKIYNDIKNNVEALLDDEDDMGPCETLFEKNYYYNKGRNFKKGNTNKKIKKQKMKKYNIKKGDWQCKYCNNINFHFRTVCNICKENK